MSSAQPIVKVVSEMEAQLARFEDIPVEITVQLDCRIMKVREVLGLHAGSVIKMLRSAGDNMDVLVQGLPAGVGEVVVIEDRIGIRITDIRLAAPGRG